MQKLNRRLAQKREKMDIFMRSSEFFCEFNSTYFYHHADMTWQKFREIKQYVFYLRSCLSIIVLFLKCRWRLVSAATVPKGGQSLSLPRPLLQQRFKYLDDFCTLLIVTAGATQREIFVELIRDGIDLNFDFFLILIFDKQSIVLCSILHLLQKQSFTKCSILM